MDDPIYRLLNETVSGDAVAANNGSLAYGLDAVGNRQSLVSTLAALQSQTATFDPNDRISGDTSDANGNTLASNGVNYTYDFEDLLLTATGGISEVYDGDGKRVSSTAAGVATKFLVDDLNPTRWPQVVEETVGGTVTVQYTHGLMRISQNRGGSLSYYGYDAGGSVRQLVSSAGVVTDTYAYDAFGNTVARTGTTVNAYQYRGEQFDGGLGFYYLRARWYNPKTGRFFTQDKYEGPGRKNCQCIVVATAEQEAGHLLAPHHLFVYTGADPVNRIDPSGKGFIETGILEEVSLGVTKEALQIGACVLAIESLVAVDFHDPTLGDVLAIIGAVACPFLL